MWVIAIAVAWGGGLSEEMYSCGGNGFPQSLVGCFTNSFLERTARFYQVVDDVVKVKSSTATVCPVIYLPKPWDNCGKCIILFPSPPYPITKGLLSCVASSIHCLCRVKILVLTLFPAGVLIFLRSKQGFCHGVSKYPWKLIRWEKGTC